MDAKVEAFYRDIFSDLSVDREEATELIEFLSSLNPPPDKLVWMRSTAFRLASQYLQDDHDNNVSLLRTINYIVHAIENTCLLPKERDVNMAYDEDTVKDFYKRIFEDLSVDNEENEELLSFFQNEFCPEADALVPTRAAAFAVGSEYLSDDNENNVRVLRCINAIVHAFELSCLTPKPYQLSSNELRGGRRGGGGGGGQTSANYSTDMSLADAVQKLWDLDNNRLTAGSDYEINVQSGKQPYRKEDGASDPLFSSVDRSVWKRPTYSAFVALLDNYSAETGREEVVSNAERQEVKNFLNAIMQTAPMQFCHKYCHDKDPDRIPSDCDGFVQLLQEIWFDLYRREGQDDSSGFEHVFVGEIKDGNEVSGFHNWIHFYLEEQKGAIDYRGYIKPRGSSSSSEEANSDDHLLTLQFRWNEMAEKFVGSSFIGVSPEFEMALYSMCFLVGEEENEVELNTGTDTFGLTIKCYRMDGNKIGTSFPEVTAHHD